MLARFFTTVLEVLFPRTTTARIIDEISGEEFNTLVAPLLTESGVTSLLPYRHPWVRAAIIEAKFHKNPKAIGLLARVLGEYIESIKEDMHMLDEQAVVIVPIPLSRERYRARGYNQVEEVIRTAKFPFLKHVLRRTHNTTAQTHLTKQARLRNMEGAFIASQTLTTRRATYLLIDDVLTTGATLHAAVEALQKSGITNIRAIALAH